MTTSIERRLAEAEAALERTKDQQLVDWVALFTPRPVSEPEIETKDIANEDSETATPASADGDKPDDSEPVGPCEKEDRDSSAPTNPRTCSEGQEDADLR